MGKFLWKSNREHKLRIFEIVISNAKWKDCKPRKNLCKKNFTHTNKFYVHEIAAVNLSKIYFLKNAKKTCKPNNRDLNRDWIKVILLDKIPDNVTIIVLFTVLRFKMFTNHCMVVKAKIKSWRYYAVYILYAHEYIDIKKEYSFFKSTFFFHKSHKNWVEADECSYFSTVNYSQLVLIL